MKRVLVALLLMLLAPAAAATGGTPTDGTAPDATVPTTDATGCAPPCGEINPRLIITFEDLDREAMDLEKGDSVTFQGTITLWADADDEGYVPPDPQEPIVIQFAYPRLPTWASMTADPGQIELDPACATCFTVEDESSQAKIHYASTHAINLTIEIVDTPEKTTGYDYGKLQLFAKSTESGIWNPGYGIKEVRVQAADEALDAQSTEDTDTVPGIGLAGATVALLVAAGAVARRD